MSQAAVTFRNVSKRFRLHHERYRSFQEFALNAFRRRTSSEDLWALSDVSFEVLRGRTFGIIGENGSGKSTALKIAAGILRPTSGRASVNGRLAALLELGAGFHPDLTGRDNIFLNASVLGFSRREIERKMDAIVDFAEIDRFLDTPLKHYSSGMQVRLGFAIAINSDPDVLITDEVLAVGDELFQRKCFERFDDLIRHGKTLVLVSHSLDLVRYLCSDAIWLDHGRIRAAGPTADVVAAYLNYASQADRGEPGDALPPVSSLNADAHRWGSGEITITRVELIDHHGRSCTVLETGQPATVRMHYRAHERVARPLFGIAIHHGEQLLLSGPNTTFAGVPIDHVEGSGVVEYRIADLPLLRGSYALSAAAYDYHGVRAYDHHDRLYPFQVRQGGIREQFGLVWMRADWLHRRDGEVGAEILHDLSAVGDTR